MAARFHRLRSIRWPVTLFVVTLVLVVALAVLWNVVLAVDYRRLRELAAQAAADSGGAFHWTFIALGSSLFVTIIVLLAVLGAQLIGEVRFNRRLAAFIATFSHELNSPLSSIKLLVQTLRRQQLEGEERQRFLGAIQAEVERLHARIGNVLRAAQLDSGAGPPLERRRTALRSYLGRYLEERREVLARLEPPAELVLAPGPDATVEIDPHQMRHVLDNLIDNAVRYRNPAPLHIEVAVVREPERGRVAIEVRDDGSGLDPRDLQRIFERFGRAAHRREGDRQQGTGLGLWIVREIVAAHGGTVRATSPGPGRGTTVRIELPAAGAPAQRQERALDGQDAAVAGGQPRAAPGGPPAAPAGAEPGR